MKRQHLLIVLAAFVSMASAMVVAVAARAGTTNNFAGSKLPSPTIGLPATTSAPVAAQPTDGAPSGSVAAASATDAPSASSVGAPSQSASAPLTVVGSPLPVTTRRLTKLRFTIDSTSEWATVDLLGGSLYTQGAPTVQGGSGYPYSTTGFAVQTTGAVHLVVEVTYDLPASPLDLRVCKNTNGTTSVLIERITDDPTTVVNFSNGRSDGVWDSGCADPSHIEVPADALAPPYKWPRQLDAKRTLAIYSPWYDPSSFTTRRFGDSPLAPFDGSELAGVTGMVNQAADTGVDGFVYWYNGASEADRRYDLLMQAAASRPGFTVAAELDLGALGGFATGSVNAQGIESWARTLLARSSSPSYMRVAGRPVLFVWGTSYMSPAVWQQARQALASAGLSPFVVADSIDTSFGFDGFWVLNPNNVPDANRLPSWYDYWAQMGRLSPDRSLGSAPGLWAAGISPGEDDSYSGKSANTWWSIPRLDGVRYDQVWQAAAMSDPEWMVISSWNDFHEATYVQPSRGLGTRALDQTRAWSSWFRVQ